MDTDEVRSVRYAGDYSDREELVWATEVQCTGTESRLDECFFPQEFGDNTDPRRIDSGADTVPGDGIPYAPCVSNNRDIFAVVCRRFEIPGARLPIHTPQMYA